MRLPVQETLPVDPWELEEEVVLEVPGVGMEAETVGEEEAVVEEEGEEAVEATRAQTGGPPAPEVSTLLR